MFDKYIIGPDTLRNIAHDAQTTGFAFDAKLAYYRGLGLSMVEDIVVTVDGTPIPRDAIRFHDQERGALTLDELETCYDGRWEFGTYATIEVAQPGGLSSGEHTIEIVEKLRVSYLPFLLHGADSKTLSVAA